MLPLLQSKSIKGN